MSGEREKKVADYLDSFLGRESAPRVKCCESSRSLYCPECLRLLVPKDDMPKCLRDRSLVLPFELHVIIDDRRTAATGLHAVTLLSDAPATSNQSGRVKLIDPEGGIPIPDYQSHRNTYLLFPSKDSVPLSSIDVADVSTVVVLDCKWSKASIRLHPSISSLPKVHLSAPPEKSHYWRWHNAGPGRISTIEAIYYAALELAPKEQHEDLIHLMWLFAVQRAAICKGGIWKDRVALPFTDDGKEEMRALRRKRKPSEISQN